MGRIWLTSNPRTEADLYLSKSTLEKEGQGTLPRDKAWASVTWPRWAGIGTQSAQEFFLVLTVCRQIGV